jgi:hypothetical protein
MLKRDWGRVPKAPDESGNYRCSRCKEWKPAAAFNKNKTQKSGLNYMCRDCSKAHVRSHNLPTKYGITTGDFAAMLLQQGGKCACCSAQFVMEGIKSDRPCVDHNHKTGEVRSLLCGRCNLAAGNVLDSSEMAEKLAAYLRKWNC